MDTYEVNHTLNVENTFKQAGIAAMFFGRAAHFKKALKEFSFLDDIEKLTIRVSKNYPLLTF